MEVLLILVVVISNIMCFYIGAKVGQAVIKNEEIEIPNPIKVVQEHIEENKINKVADKELDKYKIIYENIENYDGTEANQKDIPN